MPDLGNAAEHLWMAQLLLHDFDAYLAVGGNVGFDIACFDRATGKGSRIRVKSAFGGQAKWHADAKGAIFKEMGRPNDFVGIAVGLPQTRYYLLPTSEMDRLLRDDFAFYVAQPGRGGSVRNPNSSNRYITFNSDEKPTDKGHGYAAKFAKYENAWNQLR